MYYRREIDGLRAIAVTSVILSHADFAVFHEGYIGVDVFFVISGFLITQIIISDLENSPFSISNFYERRILRILPALFFVIIVSSPFAYLWMLPSQFSDFALSVLSTVLFASDLYFWRQDGYFTQNAELEPFLHTWSLAIEEQYYLLFPFFLIFSWRLGRTFVWVAILLGPVDNQDSHLC
jgi:peptidoglycan/LPS O-acetylase OafA/YrhL